MPPPISLADGAREWFDTVGNAIAGAWAAAGDEAEALPDIA